METQEKTLTLCVYCRGARWTNHNHLCHPHDPVLVVASRYDYFNDYYDYSPRSKEFYEVRAAARLEIIKLREASEKSQHTKRYEKVRCRCKLCVQTPQFHRIVIKNGQRVRYRNRNHGELPQS